jgi:hypothetical protein
MGHTLKGNRVRFLSEADIKETARRFCRYLKINRSTVGSFAEFLEGLTKLNICLDPVDDREWLGVTEATCDPSTFRILLPDSTYTRACYGDHWAISTIFHEIGHLVLAHRPVLHKAGILPPAREEDAEWQADEFSTIIAKFMGISPWQMCFDFRVPKRKRVTNASTSVTP